MTSWKYAINIPLAKDLVPHPADSKLTNSLVEFYRDFIDSALMSVNSKDGSVPCLKVTLDENQLDQLNELHATSDWVLTLDPYLGIEYYDCPTDSQDKAEKMVDRYVLDYVPEFIEGHGQRLILSTSWTDEAARILDQVLQPMGIESNARSVNDILRALKSLSGRLALKIASYPTLAREAISLAIVLMVLESREELKSAFLIPLDPHADLIRQAARDNGASSLLRSDVLLINLGGKQPIFQLIEVKYRSGAEVDQDLDLLDQIVQKNANTEKALRTLFFPEGYLRVDRHLQLSRLSNLFGRMSAAIEKRTISAIWNANVFNNFGGGDLLFSAVARKMTAKCGSGGLQRRRFQPVGHSKLCASRSGNARSIL
jgi:DNA phosphorothioation-dependent restriction protein DptH